MSLIGDAPDYVVEKKATLPEQRELVSRLEKMAKEHPSYYNSILVQIARRDLQEMLSYKLYKNRNINQEENHGK